MFLCSKSYANIYKLDCERNGLCLQGSKKEWNLLKNNIRINKRITSQFTSVSLETSEVV